jgi:hypothetical protein
MTSKGGVAKKIAINKNNISNNFFNRTNMRSTRQKVATLIQLDYIAFQIENSLEIAVYDANSNSLNRMDVKDLIEPYIFPAMSNSYDNQQIAKYLDPIFRSNVGIFNSEIRKAKPFDEYRYVRGLEYSKKIKRKVATRIKKKIEKQKNLRRFYNVSE